MCVCVMYVILYYREAYQTMRQSIVEMVLATDMSKHFEHLSKFTTGVTSQVSYCHNWLLFFSLLLL